MPLWQQRVPGPAFQGFYRHAAGNAGFQSLEFLQQKRWPVGLFLCLCAVSFPHSSSFQFYFQQQQAVGDFWGAVEWACNESRVFLGQPWDSWHPRCGSLNRVFARIWPSARSFLSKQRASHCIPQRDPWLGGGGAHDAAGVSAAYPWISRVYWGPPGRGFLCPSDVKRGHRRIGWLAVGGSAGPSVREALK